jgi:hypothetical protein
MTAQHSTHANDATPRSKHYNIRINMLLYHPFAGRWSSLRVLSQAYQQASCYANWTRPANPLAVLPSTLLPCFSKARLHQQLLLQRQQPQQLTQMLAVISSSSKHSSSNSKRQLLQTSSAPSLVKSRCYAC